MKVCEKILRYLAQNGVKEVFGVPSATFSPIVDAMNDFKDIEYVRVRNEQAAGFSAAKASKVTGKLSICLLSGSVGIANAINGIAEARQSKSPVLVIGGYVNRWQQGLGAIQELEGVKLLSGITKHSVIVKDSQDIIKELKKAMEIAMEHPRGPVHVGIPLDIQKELYTGEEYGLVDVKTAASDYIALDKAVNLINQCEKGLVIVGGGCRGLGDKIKKLEEKLNWPIVSTTSGKAVLEEDYRLHMGNFGFPGTDLANRVVLEDRSIECILALGTQLGENSTQNFNKELVKGRKLIHIDIDKNTFNKAYNEDIAVVADLSDALEYLETNILKKYICNDIDEPLNDDYEGEELRFSMRRFFENITKILPKNTFYMNDIGSSQNYCYKFLNVPREGDFECNICYGCMASTTGAIGIARANPDRPIAVVIGDGSFQMNYASELATMKQYNLKIITFVVKNGTLEFVRKGHEVLFERTMDIFYDPPIDILKIAGAYGIPSIKVEADEDLDKLRFIDLDGPIVVELNHDINEPMPLGRLSLLKKSIK